MNSQKEHKINGMFKKIKFYQGKGGDGKYAIPQELE